MKNLFSFDDIFHDMLKHYGYITFLGESADEIWRPPTDIIETINVVWLFMDVPGLDISEIQISMFGGELVICGHKKDISLHGNVRYIRIERTCGYFIRRFRLPSCIDMESITATYKGGVLKVKLSKAVKAECDTTSVIVDRDRNMVVGVNDD